VRYCNRNEHALNPDGILAEAPQANLYVDKQHIAVSTNHCLFQCYQWLVVPLEKGAILGTLY
jgi:hypothetical protein